MNGLNGLDVLNPSAGELTFDINQCRGSSEQMQRLRRPHTYQRETNVFPWRYHSVKKDKANLIAGACLGAFGIYVISAASKLPYVSEVGPGPGFFPLWLGIGLLIFASLLMLSSVSVFTKDSPSDSPVWEASGRALAGWFGLMVATALFGWIGFSASFVILTVYLIVALDRRPFLLSLGVGIGLAVAFHLLFVRALDVSLPTTRWGF